MFPISLRHLNGRIVDSRSVLIIAVDVITVDPNIQQVLHERPASLHTYI